MIKKKYTWCFMGQVRNRPTRQSMLKELKKLDGDFFENSNSSWQSSDMIGTSEYREILRDSLFVPCPRGNNSVDSFRFSECLEVGSIPIPESGDNYWDNLLGDGHPVLIQANDNWSGMADQLKLLMSNEEMLIQYRQKILDWWSNYKSDLNFKIKSIINSSTKKSAANSKIDHFLSLKDQWSLFKDYDSLKFFDSQIQYPDPPEETFSTYNPGKKIAVVSLYSPEISTYAYQSELNIKSYCENRGYTFYVYRGSLDSGASANWSKAKAIFNHIKDHEYIIWMDSDTFVVDFEQRFESFIGSSEDLVSIFACEDIGYDSLFNSGVLIFKNDDYSALVLKYWNDFDGDRSSLYSSGGDQEILCDIVKKIDPNLKCVKIFPMASFNTDPRLADKETFILHFMAFPNHLKNLYINYLNPSI